MSNNSATNHLFLLAFVVLCEALTYYRDPRKALKRSVLGIALLLVFMFYPGIAGAAISEMRSFDVLTSCGLVSVPYTLISCVVVVIYLHEIDNIVLNLYPRVFLILSLVLPAVFVSGFTASCYWFYI